MYLFFFFQNQTLFVAVRIERELPDPITGKRQKPGDLVLVTNDQHTSKQVWIDVAVASPYNSESHRTQRMPELNREIRKTELFKTHKYESNFAELDKDYNEFVPLVANTFGVWGKEAHELFTTIAIQIAYYTLNSVNSELYRLKRFMSTVVMKTIGSLIQTSLLHIEIVH